MTEADFLHEEPPGFGGGGKASPLTEYLRKLERALRRGDATEHTHRPALKELIEALDEKVICTNEPKRSECGAPDYVVSRKRDQLSLGYIEAKEIGADLVEIEGGEQLKRYLASLPNLLLTDYVEFRWFVDGRKRETFRIANAAPSGKLTPVEPDKLERAFNLLIGFLSQKPVDITSAEELARRLANLAHIIRNIIIGAFLSGQASQQIRDWRGAFAATLLPELAPHPEAGKEAEAVSEFADMFAQTLAYGLFSARAASGSGKFTREKAQRLIPRTNPFLRTFFEQITGAALDDEPFAGFVEDLIQTLDHADMARVMEDFGKHGRRRDPVVHFYETFLQAYDPKLRELRGVYYTPEPVVNYIVQSIDRLLKDKFSIKDGLADRQKITIKGKEGERELSDETHRVLILDPAAGTATFLYRVLDFIRSQFKTRKNAGQWGSYVHEHLLPRLFGFELLMAPYAVAHFKIGLALAAMDEEPLFRQQWSYEPQGNERVNIFLTNTLEDLEHAAEQLGPLRALSNEANSAYEVKKHKPVLVILGNPPYSGHSANTGEWISKLVRDYYFCDGKPLGERNPKWLQDDYVKFLRWGQWRIEQTGQGVLAFITNNGYLDNPTFRGMRQNLMQTFDEIYLLNLHGNSKKKETVPGSGEADKNVFDIQQGVTIGIFVKLPPERRAKEKEKAPAIVRYCDLWGAQRQTKYDWLDKNQVRSTDWTKLEPNAQHYLFIPQDTKRLKEYERGWRVTEMMPIHSLGIAAGRDHFTVAFSREELRDRLQTFLELDGEEARRRFDLGPDSRDWQVELAQADLNNGKWDSRITPILYRPFDLRQTCYTGISRGFHCMARQDVMRHFLQGNLNLGLSTTRSVEIREGWTHVFATHEITQLHSVSLKEVNYLFPLYLYPNGKLTNEDLFAHENGRRPNLSAAFIKDFCGKLRVKFVPDGFGRPSKREIGPECIFNYAYAVLHSPAYRERYAAFLRADFPHLPLTSNWDLFQELAGLGGWLVDLHARGHGQNTPVAYPEKGTDKVADIRFQSVESLVIPGRKKMKSSTPCGQVETGSWPDIKAGRVWINDKQYFEPVPESAWTFSIGGYIPAQRWLKDRLGRTLGYDDREEYQRIIWALMETKRLMSEIDASIKQHGGWPMS
jgi:predicted helicase